MSLGYENSEQTLSGVIDYYANHIETETLIVNGIDITGTVVGPTGATGPQGIQGIQGVQGPQGPQGAQGNNGSDADASAVQAQVIVLDALVAGIGASTVALGATVAGLSTAVTTVQGEVSVLGGQVETLANNTKFITSTTKTIVASNLAVTNGVSNTIELKTDGTVDCSTITCSTENSTTVNTTVVNATNSVKKNNITPYTTPFGSLNIATSGLVETINIGNSSSTVNIEGNITFNRSLALDSFNVNGFLNQFL